MQSPPPATIEPATPPVMPEPAIAMPKKSPWTLILSLLSIFALVAAGYFYWQNTQLKSQSTPAPAPVVSPQSSVDPIADWQTYTNNKYHYTVQFPSEYSAGYNNEMLGKFGESNGLDDQIAFLSNPGEMFNNFLEVQTINEKLSKKTFAEILNETYQLQKKHSQTTQISEVETRLINDIKANEYNFSSKVIYTPNWGGESKGTDYKMIMFSKNGITFAIILTDKSNTFNQILSTFRFTNTAENTSILQIIQTLTKPMVWSTVLDGSLEDDQGKEISGTLMTSKVGSKEQNKLSQYLVTDTPIVTKYGWKEMITADGIGQSLVIYAKDGQQLIIRLQDGQYNILLSN